MNGGLWSVHNTSSLPLPPPYTFRFTCVGSPWGRISSGNTHLLQGGVPHRFSQDCFSLFPCLIPHSTSAVFCPFLHTPSLRCHHLGSEAQLCPVVGWLELNKTGCATEDTLQPLLLVCGHLQSVQIASSVLLGFVLVYTEKL